MLHITPFLLFNGNCADAMTFYHHCFGGDLTLTKVGDTPMKDRFPTEKHHRIINARLLSSGIDLSATDWMASPTLEPQSGNTFAIYLTGKSHEELQPIFKQLAIGADRDERTYSELHEQPFGTYGQLTDRYGVSWIFRGGGE